MELVHELAPIPIELWEIIANLSTSSTRCIMRCINKYFKDMIETYFEKNQYILSYKEILSKASQTMLEWCIKCTPIDENLEIMHIEKALITLSNENNIDKIKQLYKIANLNPKKYRKMDLSNCITWNEFDILLKFLIKRKCISNENILDICINSAINGELEIIEYIFKFYKMPGYIINSTAYHAAHNGHKRLLEYLLNKGFSCIH